MPLGGAATSIIAQGTSSLAATGLGIIKGFTGLSDYKKARAEQDALKDPFYKIQDEYLQNRNIAANQAGQGLASDTRDFLSTESERGLGSALQDNQNPSNTGKLLDSYFRSLGRTASEDANEHSKNIQLFMDRNKDVAGQKVMQWALNEKQPYENKLKQIQERMAAGKQNEWSGFSEAVAGWSGAGTAAMNSQLSNPYATPSPMPAAIPSGARAQPATPASSTYDTNNVINQPLSTVNNSAPAQMPTNYVMANSVNSNPPTDWSNFNWTY